MYDLHNIALDTIALCSGSAIIFYLIKARVRKNTRVTADKGTCSLESFEELFLQVLRESETSCQRISKIIADGRQFINTLTDKGRNEGSPSPLAPEEPAGNSTLFHSEGLQGIDAGDSGPEAFIAVAKLSDLGLRVQEIADKVRRPKGEVDLIIKAKNWRVRCRDKVRDLAGAPE
jgi:hypothetical protein